METGEEVRYTTTDKYRLQTYRAVAHTLDSSQKGTAVSAVVQTESVTHRNVSDLSVTYNMSAAL
jgi:hypothetical protein